jgi:kinetochore protein Spc7/SPC105
MKLMSFDSAGLILKAVTERLQQASLEDNYACLLDACIEAQDMYP